MSDASWEVQKAVFTKLSADLAVPVYDHVPQDSAPPYVTIGDDTGQDWSTKTTEGENLTLTIHAWSRHKGRKEVKQLLGQVKNSLHKFAPSLTGFSTVLLLWEFEDSFLDDDGLTYHGVGRFGALIEKD